MNQAEHAVVNDENLHDHRGGTENLYIRRGKQRQRIEPADNRAPAAVHLKALLVQAQEGKGPEVGQAHQGQNQGQNETDDHCQNGQQNRNQQTLNEELLVFKDHRKIGNLHKRVHRMLLFYQTQKQLGDDKSPPSPESEEGGIITGSNPDDYSALEAAASVSTWPSSFSRPSYLLPEACSFASAMKFSREPSS